MQETTARRLRKPVMRRIDVPRVISYPTTELNDEQEVWHRISQQELLTLALRTRTAANSTDARVTLESGAAQGICLGPIHVTGLIGLGTGMCGIGETRQDIVFTVNGVAAGKISRSDCGKSMRGQREHDRKRAACHRERHANRQSKAIHAKLLFNSASAPARITGQFGA
jgi:hypothetical protein